MFKPNFQKDNNENNTIINEAYFGSKPVEKIQAQLTKARAKYLNQNFIISAYKDINIDPDMIELNRCFEEAFGFKSFALYVHNSIKYNAYTLPISNRIDTGFNPSKSLRSSSAKGYYYDKEAKYSTMVVISSGLFCNVEFTDREILAILLHEVGHNFSPSIDQYVNVSTYSIRLLYYIALLLDSVTLIKNPDFYIKYMASGTNVTLSWYNKLNEEINKKVPELKKVAHIFDGGVNFLKDLGIQITAFLNDMALLANPLTIATNILYRMISSISIFKFFNIYSGYRNEKFADAFATAYGYGLDLSTALDKFSYKPSSLSNRVINEIPLLGTIFNMYMIPVETICYIFDEHPKTIARINSQLDYCRMELDNINLDPKMEKELRTTIKEIDSYIQKTYNINKSEVFKDSFYFKKIYAYYLLQLFGGDIKEKSNTTKDIHDSMERAKNRSSVEKVKLK